MKVKVIVADILLPPIYPYTEAVAREFTKQIFPEERVNVRRHGELWVDYITAKVIRRGYTYLFLKNRPTLLLHNNPMSDELSEIAKEMLVGTKPQFIRKVQYSYRASSERYDYDYEVEKEAYTVSRDILNTDELKTAIKELVKVSISPEAVSSTPVIQEYRTQKSFDDVLDEAIRDSYPYIHYVSVIRKTNRSETLLIVKRYERWFWTRFADAIYR